MKNSAFHIALPIAFALAILSAACTSAPSATQPKASAEQSQTGAASSGGISLERVSLGLSGAQGNSQSYYPSISADGRYVAFRSYATNLVPGDTNGAADIFVYDRDADTTERVSQSSSGAQANDLSDNPSISADGRYVAFYSEATNLVPGDENGTTDIFVFDRETRAIERVSVSSDGAEGDESSYLPSISADGRYVAFYSYASNLVEDDTNDCTDIFVYDRKADTIERVSVGDDGTEGDANSEDPSISADGRYVAFHSFATTLVPDDTNDKTDIFVYDRQNEAIERVCVGIGGAQGNDASFDANISADGRYVAFYSYATNLVSGDTNGFADVFVYDRQTGAIDRVNLSYSGAQGNADSYGASISGNGRYVAFYSEANNLVENDTNECGDIFVRDRESNSIFRLSVNSSGAQGDAISEAPSINVDGRFIAFISSASNLVPGDTNGCSDIFVASQK